ncbi:MAG: 2Fe-2S iron-sulfur cluster binding domain-containing protein [Rhodospirillaceae bacterium]|nr:2Fe-2S iron-sulfur cluster binding domain-containing protein [Rhodospirillaceae bacterium]
MKIVVTLPDNAVHEVTAGSASSLMETLRNAGLPIRAECGGAMACATCHVAIDPGWMDKVGRPGGEESDLLDNSDYRMEFSRLACQIKVKETLDGLRVTLQLDAFEG